MANEEQLQKLTEGVSAWNAWRKSHPEISIDLRWAGLPDAQLRGVDLREAELQRANFSGADLSRADLRGAHLSWADLSKSHLSGTRLAGAELDWADFSGADLVGADLRDTHLSWARLGGAKLRDARLSGADLSWASFSEDTVWPVGFVPGQTLRRLDESCTAQSFQRAAGLARTQRESMQEMRTRGKSAGPRNLLRKDANMADWSKVITNPLGLVGYSLSLVFGVVAALDPSQRKWAIPCAIAMAGIALVGGIALAFRGAKQNVGGNVTKATGTGNIAEVDGENNWVEQTGKNNRAYIGPLPRTGRKK